MENRIKELIEKNHDKYIEPVAAFVTFSSQEGFERCVNMMECEQNIFDEPIYNETGNGLKLMNEEQEVY